MASLISAFAASIHIVDLDEDSDQNLAHLDRSSWVFEEGFYVNWATTVNTIKPVLGVGEKKRAQTSLCIPAV